MGENSVSIILPVYNEEKLIEGALLQVLEFFREHLTDRFEIVIVESGSTDQTAVICERLSHTSSEIRLIREGARRGFGSAYKRGLREAHNEFVMLMTADLPFPFPAILPAFTMMSTASCILSFRSEIIGNRSLYRRFQSKVFNFLAQTLLGLKVVHVNSAFKLIRRKLIDVDNLVSNGWLIDAEILMQLFDKGIQFKEIPVPLVERSGGQSSVTFRASLRTAYELIELALFRRKKILGIAMEKIGGSR